MDFDHRPGTVKRADVAQLTCGGAGSLEVVKREVEKCDVVCACCHRLRTHSRPYYRKKGGAVPAYVLPDNGFLPE